MNVRGVVVRLVACSLLLSLTSCLESDEPPSLSYHHIIRIENLEGIYKQLTGDESKKSYLRVDRLSLGRYMITAWEKELDKRERVTLEKDVSFLEFGTDPKDPTRKRTLGVVTPVQEKKGPVYYVEVVPLPTGFSYAFLSLDGWTPADREQVLSRLGVDVSSLALLFKIGGKLTSESLMQLFSDPSMQQKSVLKGTVRLQKLVNDDGEPFPVPLTNWRKWEDAAQHDPNADRILTSYAQSHAKCAKSEIDWQKLDPVNYCQIWVTKGLKENWECTKLAVAEVEGCMVQAEGTAAAASRRSSGRVIWARSMKRSDFNIAELKD